MAGAGGAITGTGGQPPITKAFCAADASPVQPREALPYLATRGFLPTQWMNPTQLGLENCLVSSPAHVASNDYCHTFTYKAAETPAPASIGWSRQFDPNYLHPPVCLADGATFVNFWARAESSPIKITFSAQGAASVSYTLTTAWKQYQVPVAGAKYNTDASGLELGFAWSVAAQATAAKFSIDHIEWVNTGALP